MGRPKGSPAVIVHSTAAFNTGPLQEQYSNLDSSHACSIKHLALDETKDQDRIIMDLLENRIEFLKDFAKEDVEEMEELEQVKIIRASLQSLKSPTPLTVYTVTIDELPGLSTEVFARIESALDHLLDTVPMRKNSSYTKEQLKRLYFSAERDFWTVLQNLEDDEEEHMVYCLQSHTVSVP